MLKAYPGRSGADLARVACSPRRPSASSSSAIIRNLERDGAIRRTPHPVHGRILQWTLTPRGLGLLEQCRRHAMALERRLGAGMNASEIATIRRWLSKIAGDLQEN